MRLLYACGYPLAQIGSEFGCPAETVRTYTAGKANANDNIDSDDEYLDENLLLRLRREKRITIVSTPRIPLHFCHLSFFVDYDHRRASSSYGQTVAADEQDGSPGLLD